MGSISTRGNEWKVYLNGATRRWATQHAMSRKFGGKWRTEWLNTTFPLLTLLHTNMREKEEIKKSDIFTTLQINWITHNKGKPNRMNQNKLQTFTKQFLMQRTVDKSRFYLEPIFLYWFSITPAFCEMKKIYILRICIKFSCIIFGFC